MPVLLPNLPIKFNYIVIIILQRYISNSILRPLLAIRQSAGGSTDSQGFYKNVHVTEIREIQIGDVML